MNQPNKLTYSHVMLILSTLIALSFLGYQSYRNQKLKEDFRKHVETHQDDHALKRGDYLPAHPGKTIEEQPFNLTFGPDEGFRLITFVTPSCKACDTEVDEWWPQFSSDPRLSALNPTLISIGDVTGTRTQYGDELLNGNVAVIGNPSVLRAFRLVVFPLTVLTSPMGEVLWLHEGKMTQAAYDELVTDAATRTAHIPME
ncbi:MAG: hypothetical protein QNK37_25615 [Acidobacteriota bacterium]|nr:hypothetical protein [Acidobacteriota bacterium]